MDNQAQATRELTIEEICNDSRTKIQEIARLIFGVNKHHSSFLNEQEKIGTFVDQYGEMHANFMLAYRHLEDARMRLGKVLQAKDGGKSVYDK